MFQAAGWVPKKMDYCLHTPYYGIYVKMNTHKATYTLPEEVLDELNTFVEQRQRSRFVAEAIRLALEIKKKELERGL